MDPTLSPTIRDAKSRAAALRPDVIVRTAFTASDTADLCGLEGASFIVRAARPVRIQIGFQDFVGGKARRRLRYAPSRIDPASGPFSSSWLVDISIMRNWFSRPSIHEARVFARCRSLDSADGSWTHTEPIRWTRVSRSLAGLYALPRQRAPIGVAIPLCTWCADPHPHSTAPHILSVAKSSRAATVFHLRLLEKKRAPVEKRKTR